MESRFWFSVTSSEESSPPLSTRRPLQSPWYPRSPHPFLHPSPSSADVMVYLRPVFLPTMQLPGLRRAQHAMGQSAQLDSAMSASLEEPQSRPPVYLSARPIIPKASVQPENTWRRGKAPSVLNWPGARGLVLEFVGIPSTRGLTPSIPQWFSNQTQLRAWEADNDSEARLWDSPLASTLNQSPACLLPPATMRPWWP